MSDVPVISHTTFQLPPSVVNRIDVSRLVSEFERIDNDMTAAAARAKAGTRIVPELKLSRQMTDFLNLNRLRPASGKERTDLIRELRLLKESVPVLHMTFASEADAESLQQLVAWARASVHSQAVLEVGLQPGLIAGVYLRTPNHVHDMSLRSAIKGGHDVLVRGLEAYRAGR